MSYHCLLRAFGFTTDCCGKFREAYHPNVCCNVCFTTDCYGKFREAYHPNVFCNVCLFCVVFNCFVFFIMCLLFNVLPMSLDRLFLVAHSIFPYIKYVNIFKRFFPTTFDIICVYLGIWISQIIYFPFITCLNVGN